MVREMKIIFVIPHLSNGGAERRTTEFANSLLKFGEEVYIEYLFDKKIDYYINPNVHLCLVDTKVFIPKIRGLSKYIHLIKHLRSISGDIIIAINLSMVCNWLVWLEAMYSKTKIVYAITNNPFQKHNKYKYRQFQYFCSKVNGIWIQTIDQMKYIPRNAQNKTFIVPNIIEKKFLRISARYNNKISKFITVGRLHPQKNQIMMIEAFVNMINRTANDDATLTIFGRESDNKTNTEEKLFNLIKTYNMENRIFLYGWDNNIEYRYSQADVFLLSSNYEGFPNALMEAMASGLPCISTDCPTGPSNLITNGVNGFLVPIGDAVAMSEVMELLVNNPNLAKEIGENARRTMSEWDTEEKIIQQLLKQLDNVIKS